jgi:hypothetical protein
MEERGREREEREGRKKGGITGRGEEWREGRKVGAEKRGKILEGEGKMRETRIGEKGKGEVLGRE